MYRPVVETFARGSGGSTHRHGESALAHAGSAHRHGTTREADRRYLTWALCLVVMFMAAEVVVGLLAHSLALISDAGHMLTDAVSIILALIAMRLGARPARGRWTYGYQRAEILSAQANGLTLLLLAIWFGYEAVRRLFQHPPVAGLPVLITALAGIVVNVAAAWLISRANRTSLNVEGAYQHILNDLFAFLATAVAGLVVLFTGFARADAIAALVVAALMSKAGYGLVRESGRIFLEAAPADLNPGVIGPAMAELAGVAEIHDLHIWEVTSGLPALSAHVLVDRTRDCHAVRRDLEVLLKRKYGIDHTTLQVDHANPGVAQLDGPAARADCDDPHGPRHVPMGIPRPAGPSGEVPH